jgi:Putative peptidoglycan binding domain/L,D-transpeptidase catalytic domain
VAETEWLEPLTEPEEAVQRSLTPVGVAVAVVALAVAGLASGFAAGPAAAAGSFDANRLTSDSGWTMHSRFAREVTWPGDVDRSAYHIEHVYELQYRLRWAGTYTARVNGHFGARTQHAVRRFQRHVHLKATGVANHATWAKLIHRTIRRRGLVPQSCRGAGWHICYDRYRHQVTLWRRGVLWNSWLVRGGDRAYQTRTGHFVVYWRDKHHVSSIYGTAMPYSQFFSGGQAFHGSPFMVDPFVDHSHGCVNMYIEDARQLWNLTVGKRLAVDVYGRWS